MSDSPTEDFSGEEAGIECIRAGFQNLIGARLLRYETAELQYDDGTWGAWHDMPIRLFTDAGDIVSILWSKFDELWIANDLSLPFPLMGMTVRWVENRVDSINLALGATIQSAMLGQNEYYAEDFAFEMWTRLVIQVGDGWLEVFNAGDENGYAYHDSKPSGTFKSCR